MSDPWVVPADLPVPRTLRPWRYVALGLWLPVASLAAMLTFFYLFASALAERNVDQATLDRAFRVTAIVAAVFFSVMISLLTVPLMLTERTRLRVGTPVTLTPVLLLVLGSVNPAVPFLAVLLLGFVLIVRARQRRVARRAGRHGAR